MLAIRVIPVAHKSVNGHVISATTLQFSQLICLSTVAAVVVVMAVAAADGEEEDAQTQATPQTIGRRASPLFSIIHK